jgi:hypothetical protein
LQFDVLQQITLERVYIYTQSAGNLTVTLRAVQNGPVLHTLTVPVNAFVAHYPINLGWTISPGTGYRLEAAPGGPNLYYNTSGATYPYTFPNAPVSITGFLNPGPGTGGTYYYFYDWVVNTGCASVRVPVTGVVLPAPPVPTIMQAGNQLTSSSATNNQWYLNGNPIPGATGQVYFATGPGSYTVVVTDPSNGCTSESLPVLITSVGEQAAAVFGLFPNPATDRLVLRFEEPSAGELAVYAADGKRVLRQEIRAADRQVEWPLHGWPAGLYNVTFTGTSGSFSARFAKQ